MEKVAAYTGTRNLYPYMIASAKSLLMNSDVEKIYFLIEDDSIGEELPQEIECINVSGQTYFKPDTPNMRSRFTYMALMRATYALMFPDLSRILSLDVDIIAGSDVSDLWELPIDDCYYAASREPEKVYNGLYPNSGVALYNLDKLRDGKAQEVIKALNEKQYTFMEQDAFAEYCQGHIYDMPSEYNATAFTCPTKNPKIIHYAGIKNWYGFKEVKEYMDIPFKEVMECHNSKKFRKTKKADRHPKYMIHARKSHLWYVDEFLIPSMLEQGIGKDDIIVWTDSFMDSMKWIVQNECYLDGIWHLQDDVVISGKFKEITSKENRYILFGFCNLETDKGNVNRIGLAPVSHSWQSIECMYIPNRYVYRCVDWFDESKHKNDELTWRRFMNTKYPSVYVYNYHENLVEHIGHLIDGEPEMMSYRFYEPERIAEVKKKVIGRQRQV